MTTILIKKKDTAGAPSAGDLTNAAGGAEIAVNTATKRIYSKDSGGTIIEIGTNPSALTGNLLFSPDNTYDIGASGTSRPRSMFLGTNLTVGSLTSGRVPYASTAGLLVDSANLLYSGTDLTVYGITVGRGAGAQSTNTVVGQSALESNTTGTDVTVYGYRAYRYGTTGLNNVAIGSSAMGTGIVTGTENTALGRATLYVNTSGSNNVASGSQALFSNTTGSYNSAVGALSLYANTGGQHNGALGYSALSTNTTGSYNIAVGTSALGANTTSNANTAVGYGAGFATTTNGNNTFVGYRAGYASTGGDNDAFGANALFNNTTGNLNTAFGENALVSNTTGSGNSGFGTNSLYSNITGSYNIAMGRDALRSNTVSYNTAIGYQAGYSQTTGGSVGQNTFLGFQSGYSNTTGSNITTIGYQAGYAISVNPQLTAVGSYAAQNQTDVNDAFGFMAMRGTAGATGYYNVAVGRQSLYSLTGGLYNVGLGVQALYSNTTASSNTAVGYQSMYNNTTGANNTTLGLQAGYAVTTGTYNTIVGSGAGKTTTTASNSTLIGGAAGELVTGANSTFVGAFAGGYVTTGAKNTILGTYSGNGGGLDIRTTDNNIVLSDGDGNPWVSFNGSTGRLSLKQPGYDTIVPALKVSGFGYSASSYRIVVLGGQTMAGTYHSIGIGYDPSTNSSGNFSGGGGEVLFQNNAMLMTPNSANTSFINRLYFQDSGLKTYQSISVGGANAATDGYGVSFPASQISSSDANTLDDYEEGTWTPVVVGSGGGATSGGSFVGNYTKIGRTVYLTAALTSFAKNTLSGSLSIGGLPFNPANSNNTNATLRWEIASAPAGTVLIMAEAEPTSFAIQCFSNTGYLGGLNASNLATSGNSFYNFTAVYNT